MNSQELELWVREIVAAVLSNQSVEDSRVELKSTWIPADKAAPRLAGHANASRGTPILWLIGVDEKNQSLADVDPKERENWYTSVQKCFDGFAPRLVVDVNVRINNSTVIALYFETHQEAPYVVKTGQGGFPELVVPWREGTRLRAARRDELLRILVSNRKLSAILNELEFNKTLVDSVTNYDSIGCHFHVEEIDNAIRDGVMVALPGDISKLVRDAYIAMRRANQYMIGAMNTSGYEEVKKRNEALRAVQEAAPRVVAAYTSFQKAYSAGLTG